MWFRIECSLGQDGASSTCPGTFFSHSALWEPKAQPRRAGHKYPPALPPSSLHWAWSRVRARPVRRFVRKVRKQRKEKTVRQAGCAHPPQGLAHYTRLAQLDQAAF
ncbi:hypothetical protein AOLI_G00312460 [Acnodon oligacanthus]